MTELSLLKIWNIIVESNTFNFILFAAIFIWIFKKIDIKNLIESIQRKIIKLIDEANKNKKEGETALYNAQKAVENLETELKELISDAEKSAGAICEKVLTEAKSQVENIELNCKKIISAEEKLLIAKLTKHTSSVSVELAKKRIQDALKDNPKLHEKYISESIDELDRLSF